MDQTTDIVLYSADKYTKAVFCQEFGYVARKLRVQNHSKYRAATSITEAKHIDAVWYVYVWVCLCFILHRETVEPSSTYDNTLTITPLLTDNKEKRGLALDGRLKDEDTNLASTTMYVSHGIHLIIARKLHSGKCIVCKAVSFVCSTFTVGFLACQSMSMMSYKKFTVLNLLIPQILVIPLLHRLRQGVEKEVLGILVSYKIKINLMVAGGG